MSRNCWRVSHCRFPTTSDSIRAVCAAGPPKLMAPSLRKSAASSCRRARLIPPRGGSSPVAVAWGFTGFCTTVAEILDRVFNSPFDCQVSEASKPGAGLRKKFHCLFNQFGRCFIGNARRVIFDRAISLVSALLQNRERSRQVHAHGLSVLG